MQHKRPYGADLTPGKQLPHRHNGREELILATVHLVTQNLWGAYLDAPGPSSLLVATEVIQMRGKKEVKRS
jgi:hypothetical protein